MRLKSMTTQLFVVQLVETSKNKSLKLCITGPLWGESHIPQGFTSQMARDA